MGNWINKLFQSRTPRNTEPEWSEWTTIETPTSLPQSQELRDYDATVQSLGEPEADLPVDAAATRDSSLASSSPHPITNNHDQQSITAAATGPGRDIGPDRDITPEERREWGKLIATALQYQYVQLINMVDVQEAANRLFGARIISDNERDMAVTTGHESAQNRAGKLIALLIRKLEANPHMFKEVCIAFERAGAESIINEIKAEVQQKSEEIVSSPSQVTSQQKPKEDFKQTQLISEECGVTRQVEMTEYAGGPDRFPSWSLELSECFTETKNIRFTPSPLHIICGSIPRGGDEATKRKRKEDMAELQRQLDEGASCGWQDENGNTPLHIAASKGDADVVNILLHHIQPNDINIQNNELRTALHISILKKFPIVTALVCDQKGCTPNITDKEKKTPLHYACSSGLLDLVKPLLRCCNNEGFVNATDENGDTALHLSTRSGFVEIMKELRKNKADPKWKNRDEITPIDIARNCVHPKAFKVLTQLKYGSFTPRAPWNRSGMRNSSSYAGVSSHRSESMQSVNSFASRSSACSDIGRCTLSNHTCSIPENDVDKD